jgi:Zn-dependent protease with chaperone function
MDLGHSVFGGSGTDLKVANRSHQTKEKDDDKKESLIKRLKRNIDALFELYFGEEILSYIHPPLEERIERIRAMA